MDDIETTHSGDWTQSKVAFTPEGVAIHPQMRAWLRLVEVAPRLDALWRRSREFPRAPTPLADGLFLALCASLADPMKREILRALFLDVNAPDVIEIVEGLLYEEQK